MMPVSSRIYPVLTKFGAIPTERLRVYLRHLHVASTCQSSTNLTLSHSDALIDEKVSVKVTGLAPSQRVTLQASFTSNNKKFISCGHYKAGEDGSIDTFRDYSHSGSFTGVEPMGLFWSVQTPPDTATGRTFRLMKDDVTTPYNVEVSVHNGYIHLDNLFSQLPESSTSLLASARVLRRYMAHGVKRIPVRDGKIRGFLFLPPGSGPFPGIVDLFGMVGGVPEYRAALLASHGYAALALAYVNYDDLPDSPFEIQPEYFLNAAEWMSHHPAVKTGGIAMVGVCIGAGFCLYTGAFSPHVKAVVSVNGPPFVGFIADHKIDGHDIPSVVLDPDLLEFTDEGCIWRNAFLPIDDKLIPVCRRDFKILVLAGEDDMCINPDFHRIMEKSIPADKKDNFELIFYPGAGHLIEPPYAPHCRRNYNKLLETNFLWGGHAKPHSYAQEDSWRRILEFLIKHV